MTTIYERFGTDFNYITRNETTGYIGTPPLTLDQHAVTEDWKVKSGTHHSNWTITAELHEEYHVWVNYFERAHPTYGRVCGNFKIFGIITNHVLKIIKIS